jgi:hypothetical protein
MSLHCVARWFARAFLTTEAALITDLKLLATAALDPASVDDDFVIPTGNGGGWHGDRSSFRDFWGETRENVLHVRTFKPIAATRYPAW